LYWYSLPLDQQQKKKTHYRINAKHFTKMTAYLSIAKDVSLRDFLNEFLDNNKDDGPALGPARKDAVVGLFLLYGSWNCRQGGGNSSNNVTMMNTDFIDRLLTGIERNTGGAVDYGTFYGKGAVQVDTCEEDMDFFCGDNNNNNETHAGDADFLPCPPEQLPCLLLVISRRTMKRPYFRYLKSLSSEQILKSCRLQPELRSDDSPIQQELTDALKSFGVVSPPSTYLKKRQQSCLRIFVSGDRMSVGKTSVCLGVIGNLIRLGYPPHRVGYIKPATQNESPQLVQKYCEYMGIDCVPIGPVVYYRGFTRAFLAGETESSEELLKKVEDAVDTLAEYKDVVIVDGVGFPAVGSICGTDNASVALASSYPESSSSGDVTKRKPLGVLLVGGPGVGSAVDAFNLNATYFERVDVPVMGAIFNKLSLDGFYSLENCKKEISLYFSRNQHQIQRKRKPFGFCPLHPKKDSQDEIEYAHEFIRIFGEHVDMETLLDSAIEVKNRFSDSDTTNNSRRASSFEPASKRQKVSVRSRDEIEISAITAGAAPSA
jgi:dethiobiotin synthetase